VKVQGPPFRRRTRPDFGPKDSPALREIDRECEAYVGMICDDGSLGTKSVRASARSTYEN